MNHAVFCVTPRARCNLVGADAVLAVGDHPHGRQPLVQTERRILEDRPGLERELPLRVLGLALPALARLVEVDAVAAAGRARDAVRPAASDQIFQAVVGVAK